jgi:hypothetical protein
MDWHLPLTWIGMGFFGGLGFLVVGTLYRLIVKS